MIPTSTEPTAVLPSFIHSTPSEPILADDNMRPPHLPPLRLLLWLLLSQVFCTTASSSSYYHGGCLAQRLAHWTQLRVCNSDDDSADSSGDSSICTHPPLDYLELRIYSQNWEGGMINAWILQIVLSELLNVPTTVETGVPDVELSLYHPSPNVAFGFGVSTDLDALRRANDAAGSDCRVYRTRNHAENNNTNNNDHTHHNYLSCAHVIPEVWQARRQRVQTYATLGHVEPNPSFLGTLAGQGWYIPRFVGEQDPTLTSYMGMVGQRRKLAETFLWPTTWGEYCAQVADCTTTTTAAAARSPHNATEAAKYFVPGLYTGHFRKTAANDCDAHPTTCTGHLVDYYCGWGGFAKQQAHHLGIAVESKQVPSYGYSPSQMPELWAAANATRSPILMLWYTPERLVEEYIGTDAEFHRVTLTPPTQVCVENRLSAEEKCSNDTSEQVGSALGACDYTSEALTKVYASGLYGALHSNPNIPVEIQSPAYSVLQRYSITELQMAEIFGYWTRHPNFTDPAAIGATLRDATCDWVVDNLDYLRDFVPRTYPRTLEAGASRSSRAVSIVASLVGVAALMAVLATGAAVWHNRKDRVIKYAQVDFLFFLVFGLFFVSMGAILLSVAPTNGVCIASVWMVNFGYTLELAPLIVKIGALNQLMNASMHMRRIHVPRKSLFGISFGLCGLILVYCILWTVIDPSHQRSEFILTDELNDMNETILKQESYCSSLSNVWQITGISWYIFLLVCASAVAFQTRNLRQDFNETQTLILMIYSHFFFTAIRFLSYLIAVTESQSILQRVRSILISLDAIATVVIYFVPKFFTEKSPGIRQIYSFRGDDDRENDVEDASTEHHDSVNPTTSLTRRHSFPASSFGRGSGHEKASSRSAELQVRRSINEESSGKTGDTEESCSNSDVNFLFAPGRCAI